MYANDFWLHLIKEYQNQKPKHIILTTYGYYTAVRNWKYEHFPYYKMNPLQKILYYIDKVHSHLIITPTNDITKELAASKRIFPNITYRIHPSNHAKIVLFVYEDKSIRIWQGSCNLTTSKHDYYHDSYSEVLDTTDLKRHLKLINSILDESAIT